MLWWKFCFLLPALGRCHCLGDRGGGSPGCVQVPWVSGHHRRRGGMWRAGGSRVHTPSNLLPGSLRPLVPLEAADAISPAAARVRYDGTGKGAGSWVLSCRPFPRPLLLGLFQYDRIIWSPGLSVCSQVARSSQVCRHRPCPSPIRSPRPRNSKTPARRGADACTSQAPWRVEQSKLCRVLSDSL